MQRSRFAAIIVIFLLVGSLAGVVIASYSDVDKYITSGLVLASVGAYRYSISSLEAAAKQATSIEQKAEVETALGLVYYQAALDAIEKNKSPNAYLAKAREHYLNAAVLDDEYAFLYSQIGDINLAIGDLKRAREAYEKALVSEPDAAGAYYGLAKVALLRNETETAISYLEKVVEISPDHIEAAILLAKQLLELGEVDAAIQRLKAAESIDPRVPELHYQLARAYQLSGAREKALHQLERTLQLDPHHQQADRLLQQLKNQQ